MTKLSFRLSSRILLRVAYMPPISNLLPDRFFQTAPVLSAISQLLSWEKNYLWTGFILPQWLVSMNNCN